MQFLWGSNEIKPMHLENTQKYPFHFCYPKTLNVEELFNNRLALYSTTACLSNAELYVFIDYQLWLLCSWDTNSALGFYPQIWEKEDRHL